MATQYTSYWLYQKYEIRGSQEAIPVYPNVYSVDADGTMSKVIKIENDTACGYVPTGTTQYRWVNLDPSVDYYCDECPPAPVAGGYLTFIPAEDSTFSFSGNSVYYSLDSGATWTSLANNTSSPTVNAGNKIMWKGELTPTTSGIGKFSSTGRFTVEGNTMSLLYGDNFIGQTSLSGKDYALRGLFNGCTGVTSVENMELPATTLSMGCYQAMFNNCTSLTTPPELPSTSLATNCYFNMFQYCTGLTQAPELPAMTLAESCYARMFYGCSSLTTAPELPATTLVETCYQYMFDNCTSLNYIKCLATDISATSCLLYWVNNVASTGTFVKNAAMSSWEIGRNGIPSGWVVENAPETVTAKFSATYSDGRTYSAACDGSTSLGDVSPSGYETSAMTSAVIGDCVRSLGTGLFWGFPSLASVEVSDSVTSIWFNTFAGCSNLTSVTMTNVTSIEDDTFKGCTNLRRLNSVIDGVANILNARIIKDYSFHECSSLTSVIIPNSVTKIGNFAFQGCSSLTSVTIGSGVTSIGQGAFDGCSGLTGITVNATTPPTLGTQAFGLFPGCPIYVPCSSVNTYRTAEKWSDYARRILPIQPCAEVMKFKAIYSGNSINYVPYDGSTNLTYTDVQPSIYHQTGMTLAIIGDFVTSIGMNAFSSCRSLTSIDIPSGVTSIDFNAFRGCSGLTNVTIGSGVTSIGYHAFDGCSSLTSITCLATTPPTLENSVFANTNNCPIYVPASSVEAYKTANRWSDYADRIRAIP